MPRDTVPLPDNDAAAVRAHLRRHAPRRNFVIFCLVFAAFQWAVDQISSPFQGADKVEKKFAYFAAHKDEFDYVFIGSSRVMNQISPRVFDQAMAVAGRPCRSINLGYAAMFLPESSFLIDRVRALHPARLRGMIIELSTHTPRRAEEGTLMAREIYWHRSTGTALACATVLTDPAADFTAVERAGELAHQLLLFTRSLLHLDTGLDLCGHLLSVMRHQSTASRPTREVLGPDLDGFSPLVTTLGGGETGAFKTGGSAVDLANFQRSVAALRDERESAAPVLAPATPGASFGQSIFRRILRRQVSLLQADGIEPVYFIGPVTTREQPLLDLAAQGVIPKLLAFNDPAANPEIYQPELRADRYHLNARGADVLTRLIVQRLTEPGTTGQ